MTLTRNVIRNDVANNIIFKLSEMKVLAGDVWKKIISKAVISTFEHVRLVIKITGENMVYMQHK